MLVLHQATDIIVVLASAVRHLLVLDGVLPAPVTLDEADHDAEEEDESEHHPDEPAVARHHSQIGSVLF